MPHHPTINYLIFYTFGWVFGYTTSAVILISIAALIIKKRKHCLVASVAVLSWLIIISGAGVAFAYVLELLFVLFSSNPFERFTYFHNYTGPFWIYSWLPILCNIIAPQLFWLRRCRTNPWLSLLIALLINGQPIFEIVVKLCTYSTQADFLPTSWLH